MPPTSSLSITAFGELRKRQAHIVRDEILKQEGYANPQHALFIQARFHQNRGHYSRIREFQVKLHPDSPAASYAWHDTYRLSS